ncbi:MAG: LCP family protein [Clostridia bacterium]|nr:LCP family protein [Clostridia bacterium]
MDNLRRFVVIFTILITMTLAATGFVLALSYNSVSDGLTEEIKVNDEPIRIEDKTDVKETLCDNIFFVVGDLDEPEPVLMFVMNINTANNSMSFLLIPKDIEYSIRSDESESGGKVGKIASICHDESVEKCCEIVSSILDISIPYYIHMNSETFVKFINVFSFKDGFYYDVPVDFTYTYDGYRITFNKGNRKMSGVDFLNFMRFYKTDDNSYRTDLLEYYDGTDVARLKVFKTLLSEFINSQFIMQQEDYYSKNFDSLFRGNVLSDCNTNINADNIPLVQDYLSLLTKNTIYYYLIDGRESYNEQFYIQYTGVLLDLAEQEDFGKENAEDILPIHFKSYY